jgi:hypothetical protein
VVTLVCAVALAACGDDDGASADAGRADASVDASVDAVAYDAALDPYRYIVVGDEADTLDVFLIDDDGDVAPQRAISGGTTDLHNPYGVTVAAATQEIVVANYQGEGILFYPFDGSGDIVPSREITGASTQLTQVGGVTHDPVADEIFSCSEAGAVNVFARTDDGDVAPTRRITGASTGLVACDGILLDRAAGEIYVLDGGSSSVRVFARTADGDVAPVRVIEGALTTFGYPSRGAIDFAHDELIIADETGGVGGGGAILAFPLSASGNVAPSRIIEGATTTFDDPVDVAIDLQHDELFVADRGLPAITVFDRTDDGDVAPRRQITGVATTFSSSASLVLVR